MVRRMRRQLASVCLLICSFVAIPSLSLGQDYVFSLTQPTIDPGTIGTVTWLFDNQSGVEVNGIQTNLCYDPEQLEILSTAMGSSLAATNGGSGPDFYAPGLSPGSVSVGVVISLTFSAPGLLPAASHELMDLETMALAPPGSTADLIFCDGSTSSTVILPGSVAVTPVEVDALIQIGPLVGAHLSFTPTGPAIPGGLLEVFIAYDAVVELSRFDFAVSFAANPLDFIAAVPHGELADVPGGPAGFAVTEVGSGGLQFNIDVGSGPTPATLSPGSGRSFVRLLFAVDPLAGPLCAEVPIEFTESISGQPYAFEIQSLGSSIPRTAEDRVIPITDPPMAAPSGGVTLRLPTVTADPGDEISVPVILDSEVLTTAVRFGVEHSEDLTLLDVRKGTATGFAQCGNGPEVFLFEATAGGVTVELVFETASDAFNPALVPDGFAELAVLEFAIDPLPRVGGSPLNFVENLGSPPVPLEVTMPFGSLTPDRVHGEIIYPAAFRRGDCNSDQLLDISDAIFALGTLFPSGQVLTPLCLDACDVNDDGGFNLADPVNFLGVLFAGAAPVPPPNDCGLDATIDNLGCAISNCPVP